MNRNKYVISSVGLLLIAVGLYLAVFGKNASDKLVIALLIIGSIMLACPIIREINIGKYIIKLFERDEMVPNYPRKNEIQKALLILGTYNDAKVDEIRSILSHGDTQMAVDQAKILYDEDEKYINCYIHTLAMSTDTNDVAKAIGIIQKCNDPSCFSRLGYRVFCSGDAEKAISITESGLELAVCNNSDEVFVRTLKNNLAYYYAFVRNADKESRATALANDAIQIAEKRRMPSDTLANTYDTVGYVYMRYAHNNADVMKAFEFFQKSLSSGMHKMTYVDRIAELKKVNDRIIGRN
jgi:hypothetical protein